MPKRDKGEGSVKTRVFNKSGSSYTRYFARIAIGRNDSGKLDYQDGPLRKTKAEANADRRDLSEQLANGILKSQGNVSVSAYMDFFLAERKPHMSYKGYQAYESDTKNHIKPHLGTIKLRKLEPVTLQLWQSKLSKRSPFVARKSLACLSFAMGQAVKWRLIPYNPCAGVVKVALPDDEVQIWQPSECRIFLKSAVDDQFYLGFYLCLNLGLRIGELRGLQWSDLIQKNGETYVHIQRQNLTDTEVPRYGPPKTKKSDRILPLPKDVLGLLEQERKRQAKLKIDKAWRHEDHNLILTTAFGSSPPTYRIRKHFYDASIKANVPKIKFHALRHSAGSLWLEAGLSLTTVSARLGHGDITTTARIYIHHFREAVEGSGLTMEQMLKGEAKGVTQDKEKDASLKNAS